MDRARRNGHGAVVVGHHACFLYWNLTDFVAGVGEFVLDGLALDAAVLVALPPQRIDAVRRSLDTLVDRVEFVDMAEMGRNPGRILGVLHGFAARHRPGPVRIVGEPIWAGRGAGETIEAIRHEALLNLAFPGTRVEILCPYQIPALDTDVLSAACRTHSMMLLQGHYTSSFGFVDPVAVAATCDQVTLPEPLGARTLLVTAATAGSVPARIAAFAIRGGAPRRRAVEMGGAVAEAVALVLAHGRAITPVRLWRDHDHLIVEITTPDPVPCTGPDRVGDALRGRLPPGVAAGPQERWRWRVHQLCDLVETRATPHGLLHRLHLQTPD